MRPGYRPGLAHLATPASDIVTGEAGGGCDIVKHVMQGMVRRAAHQDTQPRLLARNVLQESQASLGPDREYELVPRGNDGDRPNRHRLLEDTLAAHRDREHCGGVDDREIDLSRCHRKNSFRRADTEECRGLATMRVPQHDSRLNIGRHRIAGGTSHHLRCDFEYET